MNDAEKKARDQNNTLASRGSDYGPYPQGLAIREQLMKAITDGYKQHHKADMSDRHKSYFWDICNKLCRLAITPTHSDSWHDVVGYGQLIEAATITETKDALKQSNKVHK